MTVETNLSVDQAYVRSFSEGKGEPDWFTELRIQAFAKSEELPMPKPDKTRITRWNFTQFTQHTIESDTYQTLDSLPEAVKSLIDLENANKNLY
ncbi:Fe-S cluster assembly protein SufD, partial [Heyndrickxia sporothermodurans]